MQSVVEVNLRKRATERLNTDKLRGIIQKIGPLIPSNRMKFWTELEGNDETVDFAANMR